VLRRAGAAEGDEVAGNDDVQRHGAHGVFHGIGLIGPSEILGFRETFPHIQEAQPMGGCVVVERFRVFDAVPDSIGTLVMDENHVTPHQKHSVDLIFSRRIKATYYLAARILHFDLMHCLDESEQTLQRCAIQNLLSKELKSAREMESCGVRPRQI
jgi:hypothetical protein